MTKTVPWKENLQNVVRSSFVLIIRQKQPILHISSYIENIRKSELLPQSTQNQGLRIFAAQKRLKNQFLFRGQQPDGWCYRCNCCCGWRGNEISRKALYINVSEVFKAILGIFRNSSKYHLFPQKRGFVHILSTDFWAVDGKYRYESLINLHFQSFAHFERGSFSVSK